VTCAERCDHEVARDRWGRPVLEGETYTRVSTLSKAPDSLDNLIKYRERNVARAIARNPDLAERVIAARNDDAMVNAVVRDAGLRIGTDAAASRGTTLHGFAAAMGLGEELPDDLTVSTRTSLDAYSQALEDHGLEPVAVEQFVAHREHRFAGTFDVVLRDSSGRLFVSDIKTGRKSWERTYSHAVAVQLASYQMGERFCPVNGWLGRLDADPDIGLLISLPIDLGECHIDAIDLQAGREGLGVALALQRWRTRKGLAVPLVPQDA
jgi:hypothetical protein